MTKQISRQERRILCYRIICFVKIFTPCRRLCRVMNFSVYIMNFSKTLVYEERARRIKTWEMLKKAISFYGHKSYVKQVKPIYFDSVMCWHSYLLLLFGIDCLFIVLFTKHVFIFPKIYIIYFTKHQRKRSSNYLILVRVTYLKFT